MPVRKKRFTVVNITVWLFKTFTSTSTPSPPALDRLSMPPLPLARELSTHSLSPRPDLRFVLRPREHNLIVTRAFRCL